MHQPQHGVGLAHVSHQFANHPLLGACQGEGQTGLQLIEQGSASQARRMEGFLPRAFLQHAKLMRHHLFHHQPLHRRVLPVQQQVNGIVRARIVQFVQGLAEAGQTALVEQGVGDQFLGRMCLQIVKCLGGEVAQGLLAHSVGGGVNRGQGFFQGRQWQVAMGDLVFRMIELQPGGPRSWFAVHPDGAASLQIVFLCGSEMKEAQRHHAGAICHLAQQRPAPPKHHICRHDFSFDDNAGFRAQAADGRNAGSVFVAKGQVKEQVFQIVQAELGQFLSRSRSHALEAMERKTGERVRGH